MTRARTVAHGAVGGAEHGYRRQSGTVSLFVCSVPGPRTPLTSMAYGVHGVTNPSLDTGSRRAERRR